MFRSTTIIRELILSLAKVILKHLVKYVVMCYVVVWQHAAHVKLGPGDVLLWADGNDVKESTKKGTL
jgi:hypothetical protein